MVIKHFLKKWYVFVLYIIFVIITPLVNVKSGLKSAEMLDSATNGDYQAFASHLLFVLLYFVAHGFCLFLLDVIRTTMIRGARQSLKQDMFTKLMDSSNDSFSKPDIGLHIAAFSNDISILEYRYFEQLLRLTEGIISIITAAAALFTLHTKLAIIIVFGEIFGLLVCWFSRKYSVNKNKLYIDQLSRFTQKIKDFFSAFQTIRYYSVEKKINKKFSEENNLTEDLKNDADSAVAFVNILAQICNAMMVYFVVVGYGIMLVMQGEITVGLVYAAYCFSDQIISPTFTLISATNSIESVKSIVARIKKLSKLDKKQTLNDDITFDSSFGIALNNVSVTFDGTPILNNISHRFYPGKKYLIIGKNGCGKSTLLRLLKKSVDTYEGDIIVDGRNIKEISNDTLSAKVSYINETVSLLCDTVKQNIVLFRDVEETKLKEIIEMVGLTVPLDRVIRDGERNLSSGETRRIEIARSLLNKVGTIIYDEAISTLDVQTAFSIERTLLELKNQTVIFVSHNFSSTLITKYDEIILMDKGTIIDCGTHNDLMSRSKYYQNIMQIKNGEYTASSSPF